MANGALPFELDAILRAPDSEARTAAWERLVARHSRLLLAVARSFGGGRDEAMERYAYLLEKLSESDHHRLRAFRADGRASFTTWLTVAARRLCLDHLRSRYGRTRPTQAPDRAAVLRRLRRRLADSAGAEVDTDLLVDGDAASAEGEAIRRERDQRLHAELARLPASDRLLLALRFEDDLSAAKIAGFVGLPTAFHVYRRLNAILAALRSALESQGIDGVDG
jgi:RNA polymerase sigma factor (sigma-70 family)